MLLTIPVILTTIHPINNSYNTMVYAPNEETPARIVQTFKDTMESPYFSTSRDLDIHLSGSLLYPGGLMKQFCFVFPCALATADMQRCPIPPPWCFTGNCG